MNNPRDEAASQLELISGAMGEGKRFPLSSFEPLNYLWGALLLAACIGTWWLFSTGKVVLIAWLWIGTFALGSLTTVVLRRRTRRQARLITPQDRAIGILWGAVFFTDFLILGSGRAGSLSAPITLFFMGGFACFATGAFSTSWEAYASAVVWWASGAVSAVYPAAGAGITAFAVLFGLVMPGWLYARRTRRGSASAKEGAPSKAATAWPFRDARAVRELLEDTDTSPGRFGLYLLIAGFAALAAEVASYILANGGPSRYGDLWRFGALIYVFNVAMLLILGGEEAWGTKSRSVTSTLFRIFLGLNLALLFMALTCLWLGLYVSGGDFAFISGLAFFVAGSFLRSWPLYLSAGLYWAAGLWMNFHIETEVTAGAALALFGQVLPALLLRASATGRQVENAEAV